MATSTKELNLSDKRLSELLTMANAWTLANGVSMLTSGVGEIHRAASGPYALFPSIVPRSLLHTAKSTMVHFNSLIHKVSLDHEFLEKSLKNVIEIDDFMARLWNIYIQVRAKGVAQPLMLGLFRNDFMMNVNYGEKDDENVSADQLTMKQIEFNTIAASFAGLTEQLSKLHQLILSKVGKDYTADQTPENKPATGLSAGFVKAWELYKNPEAVILFVVSSKEVNVMDQRALEFGIYSHNSKVNVIWKTLLEINEKGRLGDDNVLTVDGDEVAVVYFRDGYTSENYSSEKEWDARLLIEMSRAIKCPSIQHQLVGAKKIQQELARPGCLERYIKDPAIVQCLRDTFASQYSLDLGSEGDEAIQLGLASPDKFVLKPQREGGGHNLYNNDITAFLEKHRNSKERNAYIMMERIFPWEQKNFLVKSGIPFQLWNVISEIGVYGVIIGSTSSEELVNYECGHMMRTKSKDTDEGGICAGFSVLDTPFLVD